MWEIMIIIDIKNLKEVSLHQYRKYQINEDSLKSEIIFISSID